MLRFQIFRQASTLALGNAITEGLQLRGLSPYQAAKFAERVQETSPEMLASAMRAMERKLNVSQDEFAKLVSRMPLIFTLDIIGRVESIIQCFQRHGVPMHLCKKLVLTRSYWVFSSQEASFRKQLEMLDLLLPFYKQIDLPDRKWFYHAPHGACTLDLRASTKFLVGFAGEEGASRILKRYPGVVHLDIEEELKPRLEWYRGLGLSEDQLVKLVCKYPLLLNLNKNRHMYRNAFFQSLGLDRSTLSDTFPRRPISQAREKLKMVEFLENQCGVTRDKLQKALRKCPKQQLKLKLKVDYLRTLGVTGNSLVNFLVNHGDVLFKDVAQIEARLNRLPQLGFSKEQAVEIVRKQPPVLNLADRLLEQKVTFLRRIGKIGVDELMAFPAYFTYSLERRVKPRMLVLAKLYLDGLAGKLHYVPRVLALSNESFEDAFVTSRTKMRPAAAAVAGEVEETAAAAAASEATPAEAVAAGETAAAAAGLSNRKVQLSNQLSAKDRGNTSALEV